MKARDSEVKKNTCLPFKILHRWQLKHGTKSSTQNNLLKLLCLIRHIGSMDFYAKEVSLNICH